MLGQCFGAALADRRVELGTRRVRHEHLAAAAHYMALRYTTGQTVLDNDIIGEAWASGPNQKKGDEDRMEIDVSMQDLLLACPAHVMTLPLLAAFCSKSFDGLLSKRLAERDAATGKLRTLFLKMQEYNFGRVLGEGRQMRFQKLHADALSEFAKEKLTNELKIPLWVFGGHIPYADKHESAIVQKTSSHTTEKLTASCLEEAPSQCKPPTSMKQPGAPTEGTILHCTEKLAGSCVEGASVTPSPYKQATSVKEPSQKGASTVAADSMASVGVNPRAALDANMEDDRAGKRHCRREQSTAEAKSLKWEQGIDHFGPEVINERVPNKAVAAKLIKKKLEDTSGRCAIKWLSDGVGHYGFRGQCKETKQCGTKYLARIYWGHAPFTHIRRYGVCQHKGGEIGYGCIFTVEQQQVADALKRVTPPTMLTYEKLCKAFDTSGIHEGTRPSKSSMISWVKRENQKARQKDQPYVSPAGRAIEVQLTIDPFVVDSLDEVLSQTDHERLCVLPGHVIGTKTKSGKARCSVIFTCRAMLEQLLCRRFHSAGSGCEGRAERQGPEDRIGRLPV